MSTTRNAGRGRGDVVDGDKQVPPQAPAEGVAMPVNPTLLTDEEVWIDLVQMAQAITMEANTMTAQANRHDVL